MTALQQATPADAAHALARRYVEVRAQTTALAAPLSEADCQVQSMPDASPTRWHLAHTTWFFETFVLERHEAGFRPHHPAFKVLFNSYYNGVGDQHPRAQRGLVTRPTLAEVQAWRRAVDERMAALLAPATDGGLLAMVELGLQHEQQHQELILTDVLHLLSCNPLAPVYRPAVTAAPVAPRPLAWRPFDGGLVDIGHAGPGFAFDNETPRHRHWLRPYALADRLVNQGDWLDFVADGAYGDPRWWLSAGWDWVRAQDVQAPLYWRRAGADRWQHHTLRGMLPLDAAAPVTHVSYFEADAYARWWSAQHPGQPAARLPTEAEWEHAAAPLAALGVPAGNFLESDALLALAPPVQKVPDAGPLQLFGDVWEWTASAYLPYPGFRAWDGAVGEYNAKFMIDQMVLRGGSCATPRSHIRASYRNFFASATRWQFNGLRLARDED